MSALSFYFMAAHVHWGRQIVFLGLGLLAGLLLAGMILLFWWYRVRAGVRPASPLAWQAAGERVKAEAIIADLSIGLIAYGKDGRLNLANSSATRLLGTAAVPPDLAAFLKLYGEENGLMTRVLMKRNPASAIAKVEGRSLRIVINHREEETQGRLGSIVSIQDVSEAEQEEKKRKEFVANVSHELKTPLTTIIGYTESLLDWGLQEKNEQGIERDVQRIHDDALRMQQLVTDLLLLSSLDSQKHPLSMGLLDLEVILRQTAERMRWQYEAKEQQLTLNISKGPLYVFANLNALERVIQNIIENAIKYCQDGAEIHVVASRLNDQVYFKISDNGRGIEEQHLPHLFERFYRVDVTGSRLYGGTGLGLAIVKELLELHDGAIDVQSTLGRGTSFNIFLPYAPVLFERVLAQRFEKKKSTYLQEMAEQELLTLARELGQEPEQLSDLQDAEALAVYQDLFADLLDDVNLQMPSFAEPSSEIDGAAIMTE